MFWWRFGGDRSVLKPGRLVTAVVRDVLPGIVFVTIPELGDLDATIVKEDLTSLGHECTSLAITKGEARPARWGPPAAMQLKVAAANHIV